VRTAIAASGCGWKKTIPVAFQALFPGQTGASWAHGPPKAMKTPARARYFRQFFVACSNRMLKDTGNGPAAEER
jgi:hypothetical protein